MSNHQVCVTQRDSPPSIDYSDEKADSCSSLLLSPESPSDADAPNISSKGVDIPHYDIIPIDEMIFPATSVSFDDQLVSSVINLDKELAKESYKKCSNALDLSISQTAIESGESQTEKRERRSDHLPKILSTLTLTDDHPLMILSSPDSPPSTDVYPDLILPSYKVKEDNRPIVYDNNHFLGSDCSGMMSLSSTEEESFNRSLANGDMNGLHSESYSNRYGPQRNTSKNNLYFTENFICSDGARSVEEYCLNDGSNKYYNGVESSKIESERNNQPDILETGIVSSNNKSPNVSYRNPPDITIERKKIKPDMKIFKINPSQSSVKTPSGPYKILGRIINLPASEENLSYETDGIESSSSQSGIDFGSNISATDDIPSPDSSSASRPENERSLYLAEVDPYGGCVALKPRSSVPVAIPPKKRIIPLPIETDTESTLQSEPTLFVSCQNKMGSTSSLDSLSDCSLHSDEFCAEQVDKTPVHKQTSNVLKQIRVVQSTDTDNFSDTETETEGPKNDLTSTPEKIPEYSLSEERQDARRWLKVTLPSGEKRTIDMKVIEPYKRVLSHGGYALSGRRDAIVVFSACYLPDSSRVDYNYVMDNLFLYVLMTLEQLVTDEYILVYLHGSASKRSMPTFHWLKKCYQLIDRRLRKSLKHLYLVHPTFWLKSIMWMTKPFISTKFSRKLSYVHSLEELESLVPVEYASIPEKVRRYDSRRSMSV